MEPRKSCEVCGQKATIHFTKVVGGVQREHHFCAEHADWDVEALPKAPSIPRPRVPTVRRLGRWVSNCVGVLGLLVLGLSSMAWLLVPSQRVWFTALQGPHVSYIVSVMEGKFIFQIADIAPDPQYPATYGWNWVSDGSTASARMPKDYDFVWIG